MAECGCEYDVHCFMASYLLFVAARFSDDLYMLLRFRFFFAILLSVYNKWMFSGSHLNFPYPLFVTSLHMVVQFCLASLVLNIWPKKFKPDRYPTPEEYGSVFVATSDTRVVASLRAWLLALFMQYSSPGWYANATFLGKKQFPQLPRQVSILGFRISLSKL